MASKALLFFVSALTLAGTLSVTDSSGAPVSDLAQKQDPGFAVSQSSGLSGDSTLYPKQDTTLRKSATLTDFAFKQEEAPDFRQKTSDFRQKTEDGKGFCLALKTNALYDLALVPNIGAEISLGRGWSFNASTMYGWWSKKPSHYYWHFAGGELGLRKYFGSAASKSPLTGHHIGIYGQHETWGFEFGKTGWLSYFCQGAGLEYGCSIPAGKRFNIDLALGVGYFGGEYIVYKPDAGYYIWQKTVMLNWFGPTKAEVSLVWLIGRGASGRQYGNRAYASMNRSKAAAQCKVRGRNPGPGRTLASNGTVGRAGSHRKEEGR